MKNKQEITAAQVRDLLWRGGSLDFLLHEGQLEIKHTIENLDPSVREFVVLCSRRFGKSYLGICLALSKCLQTPGARVAIIGPTYAHTQRIVLPLLKQHVAVSAPKGLFNHTKSEFMWRFKNGSELILSSFEGAVETLRGQFLDLALLEESALAPSAEFQYILSSVIFPTLLHSRGRIIHLTTPAVSPSHYFNEKLIPEFEAKGHLIKRTVYENPLLTETDIKEAMDQSGGEHSAHWQREYLCNIILDKSTLVVSQFDPQVHVKASKGPFYNYWTSVDMGGVRDNTVWLLFTWDQAQDKVVILEELSFPPSTPTSVIVSALKGRESAYPIKNRYVDASGQTLTDLYSLGYPCALPIKTDWLANLELLNAAFHKNEIVIDPGCRLLIKTLQLSSFNQSKTDFTRQTDIGHSDALASAMYGFRMVDKMLYKPTFNRQNVYVHCDQTELAHLTELARSLNPAASICNRKRK